MGIEPMNLTGVTDAHLAQLACHWRTLAIRGERKAFDVAQALEVEQRRRLRDMLRIGLSPEQVGFPLEQAS